MKRFIGLLLLAVFFVTSCSTTRVNITTNVPDAKVTVDGRHIGNSPISSAKLKNSSGKQYTVIVEKEGYKTHYGILQKEEKGGAAAAVVIGYMFSWLILPLALLINLKYVEGPVKNHYIILQPE